MHRIAIFLILVLNVVGCGNSDTGSTDQANAEQSAPGWAQKLKGSWELDVNSFIDTMPLDKQMPMRILHLIFRDRGISKQEVYRYKLSPQDLVRVVNSRKLLSKNPQQSELLPARETYTKFSESIPNLEITDTTFGYVNASKREADPYKVVKHSAKKVSIEVTHPDTDKVEQLDCAFLNEDRLSIIEVGKTKAIHLYRKGTRPQTKARR
jgi:hypothetical protein